MNAAQPLETGAVINGIDIRQHLKIVHWQVKRMGAARRVEWQRGALSYDDLVQAGTLGLVRAAELFEPGRGNTFFTYAHRWVWQFVQRELMNKLSVIRVPVWKQERLRKAGVQVRPSVRSMDLQLLDSSDATMHDVVPDQAIPHPDVLAGRASDVRYADRLMTEAKLNPKERRVLVLRFERDLTLEQVGSELSLTRERIRQIEGGAIAKLQRAHQRLERETLRT